MPKNPARAAQAAAIDGLLFIENIFRKNMSYEDESAFRRRRIAHSQAVKAPEPSAEYDLVHVEVFGLAHRERHHAREARRRHADLADVFLVRGLDVLVGDVIKQLGRYRTRRDDGRADVVGLDF